MQAFGLRERGGVAGYFCSGEKGVDLGSILKKTVVIAFRPGGSENSCCLPLAKNNQKKNHKKPTPKRLKLITANCPISRKSASFLWNTLHPNTHTHKHDLSKGERPFPALQNSPCRIQVRDGGGAQGGRGP